MAAAPTLSSELLLWQVGDIRCVTTPDSHGIAMLVGHVVIIEERHPVVTDVVNRGVELERFVRALDPDERADLIRAARLRNVLRPPQWQRDAPSESAPRTPENSSAAQV